MARLAEGVTLEAARREADDLGRRFEEEDPEANAGTGWNLQPLQADLVADARTGLIVLLGAALFVLLMACVNEASLLLARGTSRRGELAVRSALGAGQGRIAVQLLTESVLLALIGGAVGIGVAYLLTDLLVALAPAGTPRIDEVAVNGRVLAFAAVTTLFAGLLFGLFPALRGSSGSLHDALREGGRGDTGSGGARARQVLVAAQVALALVLLVGSGLLIRSFDNLRSVDLGFDPEGVLAFQVSLPSADYENAAALRAFHSVVHERLAALPGVSSVGATANLPLAGFDGDTGFTIEGRPVPPPGRSQAVWFRRVTPPLHETLRIPIVRGRGIQPGDDEQAPRVVVVNETLVRRYFPDQDPIGQRLNFNDPDEPIWWEIVGVAKEVKHFSIRDEERDALYAPFEQTPTRNMFYVLRSDRDLAALAGEVRATLAELDPNLAAARLEPLETYVRDAVAPERFVTGLLVLFAAVAMTLAVVGLYGVVSYQVNSRLREMGVRVALGASGGEVAALVVRRSLVLVAVGLAIGIGGAIGLTRFLDALLFEVSSTDPLTYVVVGAVLTAAAALAAALPARRAATVDPVAVLRAE
jgi:putative ABC transport system permease protein